MGSDTGPPCGPGGHIIRRADQLAADGANSRSGLPDALQRYKVEHKRPDATAENISRLMLTWDTVIGEATRSQRP
jgi:hypothetical protein